MKLSLLNLLNLTTGTIKYLTFLAVMLLSGCSSKKEIEPKAKYYLYADIVGMDSFKYESDVEGFATNVKNFFSLGVYPGNDIQFSIGIEHQLVGTTGEFDIKFGVYQKSRFVKYSSGGYFLDSKPANGKMIITAIDEYNVEGTFEFDLYSEDGKGTEKMRVTNGRFRTQY